jgi:4,5-DOPA dioxygenase extradiol
MNRRDLLKLFLTGAGVTGCRRSASHGQTSPMTDKATETIHAPPGGAGTMPVIFLAHGSPLLLDDDRWASELAAWAKAMPKPKAVLMLSAHWVDRPVTLAATRTVPLYYDFYGFPEKYYQTTYAAPGAPWLAGRVKELLRHGPIADEPNRGLDHGAYVPLVCMYPGADVPVLQVSLPSLDPTALFALGRSLAPLRKEGVLIVGSGFLTHNLRTVDFRPDAPTPAWAREFDSWAEDVIQKRDVDTLLDYHQKAPGVRLALPTPEHFVPVIVAQGATVDDAGASARFPITGFAYGTATRRSVQWG